MDSDPDLAGSALERELLQARSLITAAMARTRSRATSDPLVPLPNTETIGAATERLIRGTRWQLMCVLVNDQCPELEFDPIARSISGRALRKAGPPPEFRILGAPRLTRSWSRLRGLRAQGHDVSVRVTEQLRQGLVIADREVALVTVERIDGTYRGFFVRAPAVVRTFHRLLTRVWETSEPAPDPNAMTEGGNPPAPEILRLLGLGLTDDVAAGRLGLSVRTYRRRVAGIMRDLGATSRFQAGARAVELGLVPPREPP